MILENQLKQRLSHQLQNLTHELVIKASLKNDPNSKVMRAFLNEWIHLSPKISLEEISLDRTPSFSIGRAREEARVVFAGIPLGHEFESFLQALKQVDGHLPTLKESIANRLKKIDQFIKFETYVSLSCQNCPKVVQDLNYLASVDPRISHTVIEGKMFYEERIEKGILTVPTVFINEVEVAKNYKSLEQWLDFALGTSDIADFSDKGVFDVLIVGGGPAGNSAMIYTARKGLNTGMLVERYGGKVIEIATIENMTNISSIKGSDLMKDVEIHANQYAVDIIENQRVVGIDRKEHFIEVELENTAILKAKAVILALGVTWKKLNISGEKELFTKGVSNCSHCDGSLFSGKEVAVIGGGNQALEGALDLANKVKQVYILNRAPQLDADNILQKSLEKRENVTIFTNVDVQEIKGLDRVEGLTYIQLETGQKKQLAVAGVFIQIGFEPNTEWLAKSKIIRNKKGEIIVNKQGMTNILGIFAAGDCTDTPYKQIITSMGSGATAALGVYDYLNQH